jgi:hypothetical protein
MSIVRDIRIKSIHSSLANAFVKQNHYSGKVVQNSQLHFGAYLDGKLHGVLQFGPSMDKSKIQGLVSGTGWNEFIELNRMAFDDTLPKNSESRCIAITLRLIRKHAPHIKWVISFADGTQCGDGTIYRASGFVLTAVKKNNTIIRNNEGMVVANMTYSKGKHILATGGKAKAVGTPLDGYMIRYIYFIDKSKQKDLTVDVLPFSAIADAGAKMYKGKRVEHESNATGFQPVKSGAVPTNTHQGAII